MEVDVEEFTEGTSEVTKTRPCSIHNHSTNIQALTWPKKGIMAPY